MIAEIKNRLDQVGESRARNLNMFFSTLAGLIYTSVAFSLGSIGSTYILGGIVLATLSDWSTVYFVHSGVLAGTLDRIMNSREADIFMKLHLWPGIVGYILLAGFVASVLVSAQLNLLFYLFLTGWLIMYISGLYPYSKLN
ncbi:MAG: hypothetical protein BRC27_02570 [Nanohaloarchaea archaeon SW_10_44_10]|nr:MAG: hypothetical protein BRC27_02570 [Nanohaloarchaea archaeon SW_10_44_10]